MGKKIIIFIFIVSCSLTNITGQIIEKVTLPDPQKTGGMPLFEALSKRQSSREYSTQELDTQKISDLLWAAFGINRPDGRRTAASARNWQETDIYVITPSGWYIYGPVQHVLLKMGTEDIREQAGSQAHVKTAPIVLVYVADYARMLNTTDENRDFCSVAGAGFISQNVYLYCASEGLSTVVFGQVEKEKLRILFNLKTDQKITLGQAVGYPGE